MIAHCVPGKRGTGPEGDSRVLVLAVDARAAKQLQSPHPSLPPSFLFFGSTDVLRVRGWLAIHPVVRHDRQRPRQSEWEFVWTSTPLK